MNVHINGQPHSLNIGTTVQMVVALFCGTENATGVAVAVNQVVIPRHQWNTTEIQETDQIEVLWASSGG